MPPETQEIQYDNLRVHTPAADKLREVQRVFKDANGVSATQSEILTIIADYYLINVLNEGQEPRGGWKSRA